MFSEPHNIVFPVTSFLAAYKVHLALQLDYGNLADESCTITPQRFYQVVI